MNINQLALELEEIIASHDEHLDKASQFGMRSASVKNLMPYADAKKIVDSFDDDTDKISDFIDKLYEARRQAPDEESRVAVDKILAKSNAAMSKFERDLKKAKAALEKWAELLTGEKFQALFQEVRTQIIRLDPADPDGLDFEVDEVMNHSDGPYAWGKVIIGPLQGTDLVYTVTVGYRAHNGNYWGHISRGRKQYKSIATKAKGRTGKQFAKAMADQLLAIAKANKDPFFKSRRSVTLDVLTDADNTLIHTSFETLAKAHGWKVSGSHSTKSRTASQDIKYSRWYPDGPGNHIAQFDRQVGDLWTAMDWVNKLPVGMRASGNTRQLQGAGISFTGETIGISFVLRQSSMHRSYRVDLKTFAGKRFGTKIASAFRNGLAAQGVVELATRMPGKRALMERATQVAGTQFRSTLNLATAQAYANNGDLKALRNYILSFTLPQMQIECDFTGRLTATKTSKGRTASLPEQVNPMNVVSRFKQAGGQWFEERVYTADPARAWREAVATARRNHGYGHDGEGYTGSLAEKEYEGYKIERREPFPSWAEASRFADKTHNDKWGPAGAVSVAEPKVLQEEKMTVTVKATNQRQAEQRGRLQIKSTGRIRPRVKVIVEDLRVRKAGGSRTYPEWEVAGVRKQVQMGKISGWLFFGWASS